MSELDDILDNVYGSDDISSVVDSVYDSPNVMMPIQQPSMPQQPESSWSEVMGSALDRGTQQFSKGLWATVGSVEDTLGKGLDYINPIRKGYYDLAMGENNPYSQQIDQERQTLQEAQDYADYLRKSTDNYIQDSRSKINVPQYGLKDFVGTGIESGVAMFPAMATAYVTKNPSAFLDLIAVPAGTERQQTEMDRGNGMLSSTAAGVADYGLTKVVEGLFPQFDSALAPGTGDFTKDLVTRFVTGPLKEGLVEEPVQALGEKTIDFAMGHPNAYQNLGEDVKRSAFAGLAGGMAMGASRLPTDLIQSYNIKQEQQAIDDYLKYAEPIKQEAPQPVTYNEADYQRPVEQPAPVEPVNQFPDAGNMVGDQVVNANEMIQQVVEEPSVNDYTRPVETPDDIVAPLNLESYPVQYADPTQWTLSKDVPNFKKGANPETGEVPGNELKGDVYKRLGTAPIVVWERLDGRREVITGRHKWNLAKRLGIKDAPFQLVKESDGIDITKARMIDAESNILDGQGSIADYAKYFRGTNYDEQTAEANGLLSRQKGQDGFAIAKYGTDQLYDLFVNNQIPVRKAVAIARNAPNDPTFQAEGIRVAGDKDHVRLGLFVKGQRLFGKDNVIGSQQNIFGEVEIPKSRAEKAEDYVYSKIKDLKEELAAVRGTAKNPEAAARKGVTAEDYNQLKQDIVSAEREIMEWENYEAFPDKINEINQAIGDKPIVQQEEPQEVNNDDQQEGLFNRLQSEEGSIKIQEEIADWIEDNIFTEAQLKKMAKEGYRYTKNTKNQKYWSSTLGKIDDKIIFPRTRAMQSEYEGVKAIYKAGRNLFRQTGQIASILKHSSEKFFQSDDASRDRVKRLLLAQRLAHNQGKAIPEDPQFLKKNFNFTDDDIESFQSIRRTFSELVPELMRAHLYKINGINGNDPKWMDGVTLSEEVSDDVKRFVLSGDNNININDTTRKSVIDEMVEDWKKVPYVPFGRRGKYYVYIPGKAVDQKVDDPRYFEMFESKAAMYKRVKEVSKVFDKNEFRFGEMIDVENNVKYAPFKNLSPEVAATMGVFESILKNENASEKDINEAKDRIKFRRENAKITPEKANFKKHLIKANFTPGFSFELEREIASYLGSMASHIAHEQFNYTYKLAFETIPINETHEREYWRDYANYLNNPSKEWGGIRQVLAYYYLTRPATAIVNLTQSINTSIPLATELTGSATKSYALWVKGMKHVGQYAVKSKSFMESDLGKAMQEYMDESSTTETASRQLKDISDRKGYGIIDEKGIMKYFDPLIPFKGSEDINKLNAFSMAWQIGKMKNMPISEIKELANYFIDEAHFVYSKANRPRIARGPIGATAMTFQLFMGNYARFLLNRGFSKALIQNMFHSILIGGALSLPFMKMFEKTVTALGYDLRGKLRDNTPEWFADLFLMGMPGAAGIADLSGSMASFDLIDYNKKLFELLGEKLVGVLATTYNNVERAREIYDEGHTRQALETAAPPIFKGMSRAQRWDEDNVLRGNDNLPIQGTENPTTTEKVVTALGFSTPRVSKAYERDHAKYVVSEEARDNNHINNKLGDAIYNMLKTKDNTSFKAVINDLVKHNREVIAKGEYHKVIKPHFPSIEARITQQIGGKGFLNIGVPKKAFGELAKIDKRFPNER